MKSAIPFFVLLIVLSEFNVMAAQPIWVVKNLNHIRRSIVIAKRAKTAGKVAVSLGKCAHALPEAEINRLAKIAAKPQGIKELNQALGKLKLPMKYGSEAGQILLQDTYLRIALRNDHLSPQKASEILKHLGGTPGLTSLLKKINSSNLALRKGHMRELEIALNARKRGFDAVSLGQKFADGLKKGDTDLDVLLRRDGINFAIESKAYSSIVPDTMVKADAESLAVFCREVGNTIPVFCFESPPSKTAERFLLQKGIKCLVGTPEEITAKLDLISSLNKASVKPLQKLNILDNILESSDYLDLDLDLDF